MKILKLYTIIILILSLINSLYEHIKDETSISIIIGGLLIDIPVIFKLEDNIIGFVLPIKEY